MRPLAYCAQCGGELYGNEPAYAIDGEYICEECLTDYARERFAYALCFPADREGPDRWEGF